MKIIKTFTTAFLIGCIGMMSLNVNAVDEKSDYNIEYAEAVSKDATNTCQVSISIPYTYSKTITKNPIEDNNTGEDGALKNDFRKPVQTGDNMNPLFYMVAAGIAVVGMGIAFIKRKK